MTAPIRSGPTSLTAVARPELAVPPHVLVVPLPARAAPAELVEEWLRLEPGLLAHDGVLLDLVETASQPPELGEVAAFLMYGDVRGRLSGGPAVLTLDLVEPMTGSAPARADRIARRLRQAASARGQLEAINLVDVAVRRTAGGVAAVRLRFVTAAPMTDEDDAPLLVEVCRWFYPVPGHGDLAWSLAFQTVDLDQADALVAEFDRMAGSVAWSDA
jgi:hypothetical protein